MKQYFPKFVKYITSDKDQRADIHHSPPPLIYITYDIENLTPKYQLLHKYGQLMQNTQKTRQIFVNIVQKQTFGLANVYKCETKYVYLSKKRSKERSKAHILCVERS